MLKKRIISCLDVKDGKVVKGVKFQNHEVVGDILLLAQFYSDSGCDELVFYDIAASPKGSSVKLKWVEKIARNVNIPFCVAGGIRSLEDARSILNAGADKISINSPALERPQLIQELAKEFGTQCVVVGVDSKEKKGQYLVHQYTGDVRKSFSTEKNTFEWLLEVQNLGAGEIVLNCMDKDGVGDGYDCRQISKAKEILSIPLVASGGAGEYKHFYDVLKVADAALAAGVFHRGEISISSLKSYLIDNNVEIRGIGQ